MAIDKGVVPVHVSGAGSMCRKQQQQQQQPQVEGSPGPYSAFHDGEASLAPHELISGEHRELQDCTMYDCGSTVHCIELRRNEAIRSKIDLERLNDH